MMTVDTHFMHAALGTISSSSSSGNTPSPTQRWQQ